MLKGKLYLISKEENVIKAKNPNEKDSIWYRLGFSNQASTFKCTCGSKWKVEVEPGKVVEFDAINLVLFKEYDFTFDVDETSGYAKLKLRTFKPTQAGK